MKKSHLKKYLLLLGLFPIILSSLAQTGLLLADHYGKRSAESEEHSSRQTELIALSTLIGLSSVLVAGMMTLLIYQRIEPASRSRSDHPTLNRDRTDTASTHFGKPGTTQPKNGLRDSQTAIDRQFSILIADDNQINRLLLVNQLQEHCNQITAAENGNEALNHLQSKRFDLVFLDLQMPGYNGFELVETIRRSENPNRDVPVIAITAHALPNQCQEIIALGFDECLIKPILSEQLEEIIALWHPEQSLETSIQASYAQQILTKTAFDRDLALNILNKLLEELPQQLITIQSALKDDDWQRALTVAHKLHGSVSFCGLTDISEHALALEKSLLSKKNPETNRYFAQLQHLIQQFIAHKTTVITELEEYGH